jgi:serine/threonine-protein kinase
VSDAPDPFVGTMFGGRWIVERALTSGGMGSVYVAKHSDTGRLVALKVIKSDAANDKDFLARFKKETGALAMLSHPNIVTFLDSGVENGNLFLVMELLSGRSLRDVMTQPLELRRAFRICADVCRALAAAHKRGVIHRDLKPENVFLQDSEGHDEFAKLIDFGIVRLQDGVSTPGTPPAPTTNATKTGAIVGTPGYISPEQLQGKSATVASDVYAVGVILYELLTGRFPFEAPNINAMLVRQLIDPIVPPRTHVAALPARAEEIVLKLMERDPDKRVATATDALALLLAKETGDLGVHHATEAMSLAEVSRPVPLSSPSSSPSSSTPRPTMPTPGPLAVKDALAAVPAPARGGARTAIAAIAVIAVIAAIAGVVIALRQPPPPPVVVETPVAAPVEPVAPIAAPVKAEPPPLPDGFVRVPALTLELGGATKPLPRPVATVDVPAFAITAGPVTVGMFQKYLDVMRTGARLEADPRRAHVGASVDAAEAFCRFLDKAARLPTEDEWERVQRGGDVAVAAVANAPEWEWTAAVPVKPDGTPLAGYAIQRGGSADAPTRRPAKRTADPSAGFRCALSIDP